MERLYKPDGATEGETRRYVTDLALFIIWAGRIGVVAIVGFVVLKLAGAI
jgi:hypothetical protein